MAKKLNSAASKEQDATKMSDEQFKKTQQTLRENMREKFSKWMEIYDEEATADDVNKAKMEFDEEVKKYADQTYIISEDHAVEFAELLQRWNKVCGAWSKGAWKGVIKFNQVVGGLIETFKANNVDKFEVDYATLMYLYQTMSNPSGVGLESAMAMAEFENFDPLTGDQREEENYITYSHLLQNIIEVVRNLANIDKKLKLMRERINIETAGIKFDWKITELEEFLELHEEWIGTAVPDGEELARM